MKSTPVGKQMPGFVDKLVWQCVGTGGPLNPQSQSTGALSYSLSDFAGMNVGG